MLRKIDSNQLRFQESGLLVVDTQNHKRMDRCSMKMNSMKLHISIHVDLGEIEIQNFELNPGRWKKHLLEAQSSFYPS